MQNSKEATIYVLLDCVLTRLYQVKACTTEAPVLKMLEDSMHFVRCALEINDNIKKDCVDEEISKRVRVHDDMLAQLKTFQGGHIDNCPCKLCDVIFRATVKL